MEVWASIPQNNSRRNIRHIKKIERIELLHQPSLAWVFLKFPYKYGDEKYA